MSSVEDDSQNLSDLRTNSKIRVRSRLHQRKRVRLNKDEVAPPPSPPEVLVVVPFQSMPPPLPHSSPPKKPTRPTMLSLPSVAALIEDVAQLSSGWDSIPFLSYNNRTQAKEKQGTNEDASSINMGLLLGERWWK
ncbi:hypothetical protein Adt_21669 [Abeliophyllum distichum]|uniref:Uncharacterized protein n=1 Tax=Abeliophyllum distichum TaxID=126358 RepID=A0ABD1T069_9LAMI